VFQAYPKDVNACIDKNNNNSRKNRIGHVNLRI